MNGHSGQTDYSLQSLLDLNGYVFYMEGGHWVKFEASRVAETPNIPHGISYSLTLHDRNNIRIIGYDNAHDCIPRRRRYGGRRITWDHVHRVDRVYAYEFDTPSQLIEDFWNAVEEYLDR